MKTTIEQLTGAERKALARLQGTDSYNALKKLIDIERLELAKDHVEQTDLLTIRHLSGQTASLKKLVQTMQAIFKQSGKKQS